MYTRIFDLTLYQKGRTLMEKSIVVYRSQREKMLDEFLTENPSIIFGTGLVMLIVVIGFIVLKRVWRNSP